MQSNELPPSSSGGEIRNTPNVKAYSIGNNYTFDSEYKYFSLDEAVVKQFAAFGCLQDDVQVKRCAREETLFWSNIESVAFVLRFPSSFERCFWIQIYVLEK